MKQALKPAAPKWKMRALSMMVIRGGCRCQPALAQEAEAEAAVEAPAEADASAAPEAAEETEVSQASAEAVPQEIAGSDDGIDEVIIESTVNQESNLIPSGRNESVFGFGKSIEETPRSLTSISNEMLTKFNIVELDDIVSLTPGAFTQSFFGVAGSLDVRGTPGENYFRGVKRIDNPGNYPTPIGASDRIDIVRGPASPIYGPSKIGGYLNFVPKSARAQDGAFLKKPTGEVGVTRGSWDKDVIHGEVGGPGKLLGKDFGYYFYAETEDSGSYYENSATDQSIYQASFDVQLSEKSRMEFGGMYHEFEGNQVAGWNRLSQELIDDGTYVTGSPRSLDTNGDGFFSASEAANAPQGDGLGVFFFGGVGSYSAADVLAELEKRPDMALLNPGKTHIKTSQVLVSQEDELTDEVITLYFDYFHDLGNDFTLTNKSFYESLDNNNENAYGFSQFADTWVFEDQLILAWSGEHGSVVKAAYQLSPSIRHQNFEHGDNFAFEYFDRRDITGPNTPIDRRTLSTRDGHAVEPFSSHHKGTYTDIGLAFLGDWTFFDSLHLLGGLRNDWIDIDSTCVEGGDCTSAGTKFTDKDDALSWTVSLSYDIPVIGVTPYVTRAKQTTMIIGQGGEVPADNVADGNAVADSKLTEFGAKGSFWNKRIYTSVARFKQERVDYSSQNTVTNNTTEAKGWEAELRALLTDNIALAGTFSQIEVVNLTARENGFQFGFAGADDLPAGVDPSLIYGGVVNGLTFTTDGRKQGIPEHIWSLYLIYSFSEAVIKGLTATVGVTSVDSTYSGFSKAVKLPSYTLLNAGFNYETDSWKFGLQGRNLTNERYFRSNFPDLFGSSVVLPEVPRNWTMSMAYKF